MNRGGEGWYEGKRRDGGVERELTEGGDGGVKVRDEMEGWKGS